MLRTLYHPSLYRPHMQPHSIPRTTQRTTSSKATLARLPVPDLRQTLQRYLKSLEPFLLEEEVRQGRSFASGLAFRARWAEDFDTGLGKVCQSRLHGLSIFFFGFAAVRVTFEALDRESPNNWLDDNIWLKKAYHECRAPVLVNSNWWLSLKNDPNIPEDVLLGINQQSIGRTGINTWQLRRAAWLSHRVLEFKQQLQRFVVFEIGQVSMLNLNADSKSTQIRPSPVCTA